MRLVLLSLLVGVSVWALEVKLSTENTQDVYNKLASPSVAKKLFKNKLTAAEVDKRYKVETSKSLESSKSSRKQREDRLQQSQADLDSLKRLLSILDAQSFTADKSELTARLQKSLFSQYSNFTIPVEFAYAVDFSGDEYEALDAMLAEITNEILRSYGMSQTKHTQKLTNMKLKDELTTVDMYGTVEKNQASSFANKRQYTKDTTLISGISSLNFYPFQLHKQHYSQKRTSSATAKKSGFKITLADITQAQSVDKVIEGLSEKSAHKIQSQAQNSASKQKTAQESYANIRNQLLKDSNKYGSLIDSFFAKYSTCTTLECVEKEIRNDMSGLKEINHGKSVVYIRALPDIKYEYAFDVVIKEIVKELERSSKIHSLQSKEELSTTQYQQTQVNIATKAVYEKAELELYYDKEELGLLVKFHISYDANLFCSNFVDEVNYDHLLDMKFMEVKVEGSKKSVYIAEKEIPQKAYFKFMPKSSLVANCPIEEDGNYPISCLSVDAAKQFIKELNKKSKNFRYRLPECNEWMQIATCNNKQKYCWGNSDDYGDYENIAESKYKFDISPVASLKPNGIGLYDMCGNAREYCAYERRTRSVGSNHYSLEPIVTKYRIGPMTGLRLVKVRK